MKNFILTTLLLAALFMFVYGLNAIDINLRTLQTMTLLSTLLYHMVKLLKIKDDKD